MPRVWNKRDPQRPRDAVYVGRPSKWGNPFQIGRDGDRELVMDKFVDWLVSQPELCAQARIELRGRDLVCWCWPLDCHASVWLVIANT